MKNLILILGLALLAVPLTFLQEREAYGYSSAVGVDPDKSGIGNGAGTNLEGDVETKAIKKTADAGESEALIAGLVVAYDQSAADGYTVTRAVTQSTVGQNFLACVTTDTVATGDTAYHRCITKGLVRVHYNGGVRAIEAGRPACVDASGVVRGCWLAAPEATQNTGIIPLQSKTDSGTDLRVLINLR